MSGGRRTPPNYEWLDARLNTASASGALAECEGIAATVRERAGKAFAGGQDSSAGLLRALARDLDERAKRLRADLAARRAEEPPHDADYKEEPQ